MKHSKIFILPIFVFFFKMGNPWLKLDYGDSQEN